MKEFDREQKPVTLIDHRLHCSRLNAEPKYREIKPMVYFKGYIKEWFWHLDNIDSGFFQSSKMPFSNAIILVKKNQKNIKNALRICQFTIART